MLDGGKCWVDRHGAVVRRRRGRRQGKLDAAWSRGDGLAVNDGRGLLCEIRNHFATDWQADEVVEGGLVLAGGGSGGRGAGGNGGGAVW